MECIDTEAVPLPWSHSFVIRRQGAVCKDIMARQTSRVASGFQTSLNQTCNCPVEHPKKVALFKPVRDIRTPLTKHLFKDLGTQVFCSDFWFDQVRRTRRRHRCLVGPDLDSIPKALAQKLMTCHDFTCDDTEGSEPKGAAPGIWSCAAFGASGTEDRRDEYNWVVPHTWSCRSPEPGLSLFPREPSIWQKEAALISRCNPFDDCKIVLSNRCLAIWLSNMTCCKCPNKEAEVYSQRFANKTQTISVWHLQKNHKHCSKQNSLNTIKHQSLPVVFRSCLLRESAENLEVGCCPQQSGSDPPTRGSVKGTFVAPCDWNSNKKFGGAQWGLKDCIDFDTNTARSCVHQARLDFSQAKAVWICRNPRHLAVWSSHWLLQVALCQPEKLGQRKWQLLACRISKVRCQCFSGFEFSKYPVFPRALSGIQPGVWIPLLPAKLGHTVSLFSSVCFPNHPKTSRSL